MDQMRQQITVSQAPHEIAPVPLSVADTGLDEYFLIDLLAKHLYISGEITLSKLIVRLGLSWQLTENLLSRMRENALLEIKRASQEEMRYSLTEKGKCCALEALSKSGYIGPAPVTLEQYTRVVSAQSVTGIPVDLSVMQQGFADVVVQDGLLRQLGVAVASGRCILLYGEPGSGKTYLARRIARVVAGNVLVPHAIYIGGKVIKVFDPELHELAHQDTAQREGMDQLLLVNQHDARWLLCRRPAVVVGGELTLDMLELAYDATNKLFEAPPQLKANNGVFIVDDLGRQRVRASDLLNRWIIPMEEKRDFLTVGGGARFETPVDLVLVFSTNLNPLELADEAFLRRLGYKIRVGAMSVDEYEKVWRRVCADKAVAFKESDLAFLIKKLYGVHNQPLMPCHARDLIGLVMDECRFNGEVPILCEEKLDRAWRSYFVEAM